MIEIVSPHLETKLTLDPSSPLLYVLENPVAFYQTVCALRAQLEGEEGEYCFVEDDKEIQPAKVGDMVFPFDFDANDKRTLNLLYKKAESIALQSELLARFAQINTDVERLWGDLSSIFPLELDYSPIAFADLLKASGVKIKQDGEGLLDRLVTYLNALAQLKYIRFAILVQCKAVLPDEQLRLLYHHCQMQQIALLLVEHTQARPLLAEERAVVITEDLCEIVANWQEF